MAQEEPLLSFSADFNQSIVDEHNKTITYIGNMKSKRPNLAFWNYKKPIQKILYVNHDIVTIIEPEIEQAVIKKIDKNIDIFKIIENAKKIDENYSEAYYNEQRFLLEFEKKLLKAIRYSDDLDNKITILFSNRQSNIDLNDTLFQATIPDDFDIIK